MSPILLADFAGAVLCWLRRHAWETAWITGGPGRPTVVTEVCTRRGCRGRTSRKRLVR